MSGEALAELPRVLIVDDERANLDTFRRVFRKELAMIVAASGDEALAVLAGGDPIDLALVDYAMPGMNGVDLCRRMVMGRPRVARVLVTAHAELDAVREALARGLCHWVIAKPWNREDILKCVATMRRLSSLRGTIREMQSATENLGDRRR